MNINEDDMAGSRMHNTRHKIFTYILKCEGKCSKQSIAKDLGLSLPTVYKNIEQLKEEEFIEYTGLLDSTGGRKASQISVISNARISIGIYFTNHHLRFIAADLYNHEMAYKTMRHFMINNIDDITSYLSNELETFIDEFSLNRKALLGVGLAIPACISADRKKLIMAATLNVHDLPLSDITDAIPYDMFIDNDARCAGLAEWYLTDEKNNLAYILLNNGVGGSLICNGVPYLGDDNRGAEFGHMTLVPDGKACLCGKQGCFEAYCSALRLTDDLGIDIEDFFDGLHNDNAKYQHIWNDYLFYLTHAVNNIHMMFDCDVVLGGMVSPFIRPYLDDIQNTCACLNSFEHRGDYLGLSSITSNSVLLGIALHFTKAFLDEF